MFKHILIPTDGSELSRKAAQCGIALAKSLGAKVTGFYAAPDYAPDLYEDTFAYRSMLAERLKEVRKNKAENYLAEIESIAKQQNVEYDGRWATSDHPAQAIVQAAQETGCDLICMASHGRKGLRGVLLGSETQKVLTHCTIPVLVSR